jgi:hypothetical protein
MKQEQGRSLIEVIGVMAIGAVALAGVVATYNTVRNRQVRTIAVSQLEQMARNTKLLAGHRGSYAGVSVEYLIKSGALKNNKPPIGGADWSITSSVDGREFSINLVGLSKGECDYFTTVRMDWANKVKVNGYDDASGAYCLASGDNHLSLIIE